MFRNHRVMSFGGVLLAAALAIGIVVFSLRDAKSDNKKPTVIATNSLTPSGKEIKAGVADQTLNPAEKAFLLAFELAIKGGKMTPGEAIKLEKELEDNPSNIDAASQLLGFYFNEFSSNPEIREKRRELILSLIESHPEEAIFKTPYAQLLLGIDNCVEAQKLWAQQFEKNPENTSILMNASSSALLSDRALSEKYLLQAQALDPDNPEISQKLAEVYNLSRNHDNGIDKDDFAAKELAELIKAYSNSDSEHLRFMLIDMTKVALDAPGELDSADRNADLMISMADKSSKVDYVTENLFYYGYLTKGMVAFKNGDNSKAVEFLLKSVEKTSSLSAFGPNMSLAKALLDAGYKDAVIDFLGKCDKIWDKDFSESQKWIAEIKEGKTPDFGANLYY